jgi:hypothetical protein
MNCGIPLRESVAALREEGADGEAPARQRWEYQHLEIALNFTSKGLGDEEVVQRYGQIVDAQLASVGAAGWQPDEATDFQRLWDDGPIKWRAVGSLNPTCAFDSVTIRLKRPLF